MKEAYKYQIEMRLLDMLLLIPLAWGGYRGFKKGFMLELFSMGALVLAILGSTTLLTNILRLSTVWYKEPNGALPYVLFLLLFIVIFFATTWVGQLFKTLSKPTFLGSLDRLLGGIAGSLKWSVGSSICLLLGNFLKLKIPEAYTENTFVFPFIESLAPQLLAWGAVWFPYSQEWFQATSPDLSERIAFNFRTL